jgi:hypothetical protein
MRRFAACTRRCRLAAACARAVALAAAAAARVLAAVAATRVPFLVSSFARRAAAARWPRSTRTGSFAHEMVKNSSMGGIFVADGRCTMFPLFLVVLLPTRLA